MIQIQLFIPQSQKVDLSVNYDIFQVSQYRTLMRAAFLRILFYFLLCLTAVSNLQSYSLSEQASKIEVKQVEAELDFEEQNLIVSVNESFYPFEPQSLEKSYLKSLRQIFTISWQLQENDQTGAESLVCQQQSWGINKDISAYFVKEDSSSSPSATFISACQIQSAEESIVSSETFNLESNSDQQSHILIYTLLSNGTILTLRKNQHQFQELGLYSYADNPEGSIASSFSALNLVELVQGASGFVYALSAANQLYRIRFKESDLQFYPQIVSPIDSSVVMEAHTSQNSLISYLLTEQSVYEIKGEEVSEILRLSEVDSRSGIAHEFVDFSLDEDDEAQRLYLLDKHQGVYRVSLSHSGGLNPSIELFQIESSQLAVGLNFHSQTLLVTYRVDGLTQSREYVGEYYLDRPNSSSPSISLNKIYANFNSVEEILIFQDLFVVASDFEVSIGQHSLNRNLPDSFQRAASEYETAQYSQIKQIKKMSLHFGQISTIQPQLQPLSFMVVSKSSISVVSLFSPHRGRMQFRDSWLYCRSLVQSSDLKQLQIVYEGLCSGDELDQTRGYCVVKASHNLYTNDEIIEQKVLYIVWFLLAIFAILVLVSVAFCAKFYFQSKNEELNQLILERERKSSGSNGVRLADKTQNDESFGTMSGFEQEDATTDFENQTEFKD